jgi:ABC-2 type transport system permease protein
MALIIAIAAPLNRITLGWQTLAVPLLIVELYALVLGLSMLLSSLFVFYRDLGHIWEISMQLLIYGSGVMFPLTQLKKPWEQTVLLSNPVAQIIEDVRHALVTPGVKWSAEVMGPYYLIPLGIVAMLVWLGFTVFNRLTPRFAEYL